MNDNRARRLHGGLLVAALAAIAAPARAEPGAKPPLQVAAPPQEPPPRVVATEPAAPAQYAGRWYGWQILVGFAVFDTVAAIGVLVAVAGEGDAGLVIGLNGGVFHMVTGPAIHWLHGHERKAKASLLINAGGPVLGIAAVIPALKGCEPEREPACYAHNGRFMALGAALGGFVAGAADVGFLAHEEVRVDAVGAPQGPALALALAPAGPTGSLGLSLWGRF